MAARTSRRLRTPPRATRAKATVSYAESSSDSELEAYYEAVASDPEETRPTFRSRRNPAPLEHKRSRPSHSEFTEYTSLPKRRKLTRSSKQCSPNKAKTMAGNTIEFIKGSGVVPPWQSLPYHVVVRIFQYASYPLYDEHYFQPLPSSRWLVNMAYMCRSFAEPAITVLYSSPPLVPMAQAHGLMRLLKEDPKDHMFKYRQKVESLRIDVGQVVAYTLPGSGHLDLFELIKDLPRLVDLEFYHQQDMSPYRDLDSTIKWNYPDLIFKALEYIDPAADISRGDKTHVCGLQSWRWSSRMAGKKWPIESLEEQHMKTYFTTLRKIAFINYQVPLLKKDEEDPKHEKILANAIKALPNLEHLIFESSTLVNSTLLPLLPTSLRQLELINCWEVVADDFAEFLLTHGRQLRCLTLNHNQSLSLSFLPKLGEACPRLQVLRMNLTYFNLHATYRDSEPQYKQLLLPGEVPAWPSTLQTIELIQLRKWETEAAEMFFQSLLDSAGDLTNLRKLSIQAILNIGWRDRASFRDKWVGSLDRVFKRISEPPLLVTSLKAPASAKELSDQTLVDNSKSKEATASKCSSLGSTSSKGAESSSTEPRRSGVHVTNPSGSPPARRSTRTSTRNLTTGKYAESSESEAEPAQALTARPASTKEVARRSRFARELDILKQTAGSDSPAVDVSTPAASTEDSDDDAPLVKSKLHSKGKQKNVEIIQGMCDIVEVRIDNLRPTENQVTEADFLDEERSGDEDWDGNDGPDDGYAW